MSLSGPVFKNRFSGLIVCLLVIQTSWAQITSTTANRVDTVTYEGSPARDPFFIFYQVNRAEKLGTLTATLPGTDSYSFSWSRYNPGINGFDPPFITEADKTSSTVTDLEEGGYQVRVSDGTTTDTLMTAWVMINSFRAAVEKTVDDMLPPYKYTCNFLVISGFVFPDTVVYYDLVTHEPVIKVAKFKFKWTSDNSDLKIPNDTILLDPNITFSPPYKDTWYILTATDEFGMKEVDSVYYESIQTLAQFSVEYYDKVAKSYDSELNGDWSAPDSDNPKGSTDAMLTVRFVNESKNGNSYEWVYLDTLGGIKQTENTYDTATRVEFTYETADEYYHPYLVSTSEAGCIDTFRLEEPIFVVPSKLEIPNVFTPNGDQRNDVWRFKHQSLQKCQLTIVDRTGKVVYKIKIDDIYAWEGWDGNLHDSDRRAPEGQYYYVIEALGFDGVEYRDQYIYESWKIFGGSGNKDQDTPSAGTPPTGQDPQQGPQTLYTGWLYLYRNTGQY